jgi:exodeoxyribonuclease VII large subunit
MAEIEYIKLSELNKKIEEVINNAFSDKTFWIVAEISGHKYYGNNDWHYFTLVEKVETSNVEVAKIKAKSWKPGSARIREFERVSGQKFTNAIEVLIKVKVEFHAVYELSLTLLDIDASFTIGNLEKQRLATLEKLLKDNPEFISLVDGEYITANKKIEHAIVIQNIALITSVNSMGYTDFLNTIKTNRFQYSFAIDNYFSVVQGGEAERELVNALVQVYNSGKKYDAVVIIRGGGNKTDFLVFDTYSLSRAIAKFPMPIITGLGHHEDVSIADMMAHTHTKTPTKAAEFIVSHNKAFEDAVTQHQQSIVIKSQQVFSKHFQSLSSINSTVVNKARNLVAGYKDNLALFNRIVVNTSKTILFDNKSNLLNISNQILAKPRIITSNRMNDLKNLVANFQAHNRKYFINQTGYLGHFQSVVKLMSPVNILKKGFAIVYYQDKIVSNAEGIPEGGDIEVRLSNTQLSAKVKSKTTKDGTEFNL